MNAQANLEVNLSDTEFNGFRKLIYDVAGISLSERKRELVKSRLSRRLRALDLNCYREYYRLLSDPKRSADEIQNFTNSLTTNKTEFFRESHHFDYLREKLFPLLRQKTLSGRDRKIRIWSSASSTGQEPYTIALTLLDYFGVNTDWDIRVLASDIDTQVLSTASNGVYPESDVELIPAPLRNKYLLRNGRGPDATYTVRDEVKRLITFRQINLNHATWPIQTKFDVIFCRNVMIYFDPPTQQKLVEHFCQYLQPEGLLMIGHSESLFSISDRFDSLGDTIYRLNAESSNAARQRSKTPDAVVPKAASRNDVVPSPKTSIHAEPSRRADPKISKATPRPASTVNHTAFGTLPSIPLQVPSFEEAGGLKHYSIIVGEFYVSREPCIVRTTLGSCISACMYDPTTGIGGMNHFMLPESKLSSTVCASYGVHAMELLINGIMKAGGNRRKLSVKIFGGAHVVDSRGGLWDVGERNIHFVHKFLETEKIPILAEHTGGTEARQVRFQTNTGKVWIKVIDNHDPQQLQVQQLEQKHSVPVAQPDEFSVTLF